VANSGPSPLHVCPMCSPQMAGPGFLAQMLAWAPGLSLRSANARLPDAGCKGRNVKEDSVGWRVRTSFSPLPGIRLTLSWCRSTTSGGVRPVRIGFESFGRAVTVTVPELDSFTDTLRLAAARCGRRIRLIIGRLTPELPQPFLNAQKELAGAGQKSNAHGS